MSTVISRGSLQTAARGIISGTIAGNASWYEDVDITEDGTAVAGTPTGWEWRLILRDAAIDDATTILTLTTVDNAGPSGIDTLTISQGSTATTLQIRVPYTSMQGLDPGDYFIDLASKDTSDRVIAWAHGKITITDEPALFS